MKKILLSIVMIIALMPLTVKADEIIIGEGTDEKNLAPFVNSYPNSWCEIVYEASEIGKACTIGSMAFNYVSGAQLTANDIRIYLAETTKTEFADKSSWTAEEDLKLVYSGTDVVLGDDEWETFEFDTPFNYSGENNLVVVVAKTANKIELTLTWSCYDDPNSIMFTASDTDASYAQYPTSDGLATYGKKPVMKLIEAEEQEEPTKPSAPTNLNATVEENVEGYDYRFRVTLTWDAVEGAEYYNVYVNTAAVSDFFMGFSTGTSYIIGVDQETVFDFYVETIVGELSSDPSETYTVVVESNGVEELMPLFNIYPNPVKDYIYVEVESDVDEIVIYNMAGVVVYSQQSALDGQQPLAINISDFDSGVYFVKLRINGNDVMKRVVKL